MYSIEIASWLKTATEKIRFRRDRIAVREELRQHMEEKWEDLREQGLAETAMEQRILTDMGSAEELAPLLAEIHRPHLGYTMVILRWVTVCMLVIALFTANGAYGTIGHESAESRFTNTMVFDGTFSRIYLVEPDVSFSCKSYRFIVQKAALWESSRSRFPNGEVHDVEYTLYLQIPVIRAPFQPTFQGWEYFWAEDDQGNIYRSYINAPGPEADGFVNSYLINTKVFYDVGYISVSKITNPNIQWIDLHFDLDGEDVTVRIDLAGGVAA